VGNRGKGNHYRQVLDRQLDHNRTCRHYQLRTVVVVAAHVALLRHLEQVDLVHRLKEFWFLPSDPMNVKSLLVNPYRSEDS
jgi:hypothetical protein